MSDLECSVADGIARIIIHRPHASNAMTNGMWEAMADHLRAMEMNPDVRVICISGEGDNFCAGAMSKNFDYARHE